MIDERSKQRDWISSILETSGDTATQLASKASIAHTTLTRLLNDDDGPTLSAKTVAKIKQALKMDNGDQPKAPTDGSEGYLFDAADHPLMPAVRLLCSGSTRTPWRLTSSLLTSEGHLVGDVMIVDAAQSPEPGDIVRARETSWKSGIGRIVFRIFDPPYLFAAPIDQVLARKHRKPLYIDNDRVVVDGVVVHALR